MTICATEECTMPIPATNNRKYCELCAAERTRNKNIKRSRGFRKETRSLKLKRELRRKKYAHHTHCKICGHKLSVEYPPKDGICMHHDSFAPLHKKHTTKIRTSYNREMRDTE